MWSRQFSLVPQDQREQALVNPQRAGRRPTAAGYRNTQVWTTDSTSSLLLFAPSARGVHVDRPTQSRFLLISSGLLFGCCTRDSLVTKGVPPLHSRRRLDGISSPDGRLQASHDTRKDLAEDSDAALRILERRCLGGARVASQGRVEQF